jgi:beta-lactam-binding protein with PASTA domain
MKGKTLSQAKRALGAAGCTLGKITKPKHKPRHSAGRHKTWKLVVIGESPGAGSRLPNGSAVALKLAYRAVRTGH